MSLLRYRAGTRAIRILRRDGLCPQTVSAFIGPATGPRWLALAGIDRALIDWCVSTRSPDQPAMVCFGASAGAWRALAFASPDPKKTHQRLLCGYIEQVFDERHTPATVSAAYRDLLTRLFAAEARQIIDNPRVSVALHVTRMRSSFPRRHRFLQGLTLLPSGLLHALFGCGTGLLFERLLFHSRPEQAPRSFEGRVERLTMERLIEIALASGTVPFHMEPVNLEGWGIGGGWGIDGGLLDYHLRDRPIDRSPDPAVPDGIALMPHYQRDVRAVWFDRWRPGRTTPAGVMSHVVQIRPSEEFIADLPGSRLPRIEDFFEFGGKPQDRIDRWYEVASSSDRLGEALLTDIRSGRIIDELEPI